MSDWKIRPTLIEHWDEHIDTIMAIDENGTTDLKGIQKKIRNHILELHKLSNEDNLFTITGVVLERGNFPRFRDAINTLKYAYWEEGKFKYKKGIKRVVLHSRDIRKKEGPFNSKLIDYDNFIIDLTHFIENTQCLVFSSSIDKLQHVLKYTNPYHVYDLCLEFIIERYCRFLRSTKKNGILLLESRGKKEDAEILEFIVNLLENGNRYWKKDDFKCIKGVYFNPKWSKTHNEQMSYPILELTDLISYPIHKYVKYGVRDKAFEVIEKKIHNYPNIKGYGLKTFP
jgi:hypothetical protein